MSKFDTYFKSAFTVDNVIFGFDEGDLKVLLIKRIEEPDLGKWGLPGYFVRPTEDLDTAAIRVLKELTGLTNVYLEQVKTFGAVGRHAFGRVITVAYYSLVKIADFNPRPDYSIADDVRWFSVADVPDLAFDHLEILDVCFERLKRQVRVRPVGFELLPPKFTLTELQHLYEAILQTELDKRNFRKKILSMNLLIDLDQTQEGVAHRPARLYQFDREKYQEFLNEGFSFEVKESKRKEKLAAQS
ncbi:MAG: NUDIX hydrolase [Lewinella sp.]|nr:NUDIX hydrolase [Lewinella sp.]